MFTEELRSKMSEGNSNKMAVTDTATGEIKEYPSMRALALAFGASRSSLSNYVKTGKLFRGVYKIGVKELGPQTGKVYSKEALESMKIPRQGVKHTEATKLAIVRSQPTVQRIEVTDLSTGISTEYESIKKAAKALNCRDGSLGYNLNSKKQKPYKGRYALSKID